MNHLKSNGTCAMGIAMHWELRELFARYVGAYERSDAAAYAETFTADGVLAHGDLVRVDGRLAIREAVEALFERRGAPIWRYRDDPLIFEGNERERVVFSHWAALENRPIANGSEVEANSAIAISRCVKLEDRWLFKGRTFYPNLKKDTVSGEILTSWSTLVEARRLLPL